MEDLIMEKEISNGTMLGIVLIALAVIIALGFGIFAIAKGTANEGVTKVQTNLVNVQASEFTDYDQTVVTGTQAKSAISNFEGKSVAVLIATSAWQNCAKSSKVGAVAFSGASTKFNTYAVNGAPEGIAAFKFDGTFDAINYNALLAKDATLKFDNGKYIATGGFNTGKSGASVQFYNSIGDLNKSGMTEFVNPGAKFAANLIKDSSGTTMGIIFVQIGGN